MLESSRKAATYSKSVRWHWLNPADYDKDTDWFVFGWIRQLLHSQGGWDSCRHSERTSCRRRTSGHIKLVWFIQAMTTEEIVVLLEKVPPKHSDVAAVPTWLAMKAAVDVAPVLGQMCNASLSFGTLPESQKRALVRPLLKKPKLDPDDLNSYRPISNLTFTSMLVEHVVASSFMKHVDDRTLLPARQFGYTALHDDLYTSRWRRPSHCSRATRSQ